MLFWQLLYLQLAFLWTCRCFLHCLSCTIASASCPFYILQILPAEILHPQSALSTPCRYSPQKFYILTPLFLHLADTPCKNFASSTCPFYTLQILPAEILHPQSALSTPCRYSQQKFCILILLFPCLADVPNWIFASSTCSLHNLQILPAKILHPHFQKIHYRRYRCPIFFEPYLLHDLSRYVPYKKIDIRNSSEYGMSVGDT